MKCAEEMSPQIFQQLILEVNPAFCQSCIQRVYILFTKLRLLYLFFKSHPQGVYTFLNNKIEAKNTICFL